MIKRLLFIPLLFLLGGCASLFNPYEDSFTCPETDMGKCVPLKASYMESVSGAPAEMFVEKKKCNGYECEKEQEIQKDKNDSSIGQPHNYPNTKGDITYRNALMKKLAGMVKEKETPVAAPPKVMRILLMPYKGDNNELFMMRYVYFFADEPKWVLDNYLNLENVNESDM